MRKNGTFILKISLSILALAIIASYSLYEARNLIRGPILSITSPQNMAAVNSPLILITGSARNIVSIKLNDRQIFVDQNGNFKEKILLSMGYNIMKIDVADKFGRTKEQTLEVVLKKSAENVAVNVKERL